jgi:hypothetical protein
MVVLAAGCSDTHQSADSAGPQANLAFIPTTDGCTVIGDRVWLDQDCDGLQDKDDIGFTEPGVADVTVNLYSCGGEFLASTTTDANGFYLFSNLDEYGTYRVCFVLPDGYTFAPANQGASEGLDSDAGADGCSDCIDPVDCKPFTFIDAGLCREDEEEGGEGCTPGFWKNHLTHWAATGYSPNDVFDDVFECEIFGDDTTLGWAVNNPGILQNLAFHGVAALLNAAHPDVEFGYSEAEVRGFVCDGDKDSLEEANEAGCPLSGGNTTGGGGGGGKKNRS